MRTGDFCTSAPAFGLVAFRICAGQRLATSFSPSEKCRLLVHKSKFKRRSKDNERDGDVSGHERALVFVKLDTEPVTFARAPRVSDWLPFAYVQVSDSLRPSRQARRVLRSCISQGSQGGERQGGGAGGGEVAVRDGEVARRRREGRPQRKKGPDP